MQLFMNHLYLQLFVLVLGFLALGIHSCTWDLQSGSDHLFLLPCEIV